MTAAAFVGTRLFLGVASIVVVAVLINHATAALWTQVSSGQSAPPVAKTSWTKSGGITVMFTLITGASAINSGLNLLYLMFGGMLGYLLISGVLSGSAIRGLRLRRGVSFRAFALSPFEVLVHVTNIKRKSPSIGVIVEESLTPAHQGKANTSRQKALAAIVAPDETQSLRMTFRLPRRGLHTFGPFHVATTYPFGFFSKSLSWGAAQELVVYPALGRIKRLLFAKGGTSQWQRRRQSHTPFGHEEFHALREYLPGDNPKWIHWRSSARHSKLMVRDLESEDSRQVTLLLDAFVPEDDAQAHQRFEVAVSFAATAACEYLRSGFRVALAALAPELQCVTPDRSHARLDEILALLALAEPVHEPVRPALIRSARGRMLMEGDTILISPGAGASCNRGRDVVQSLGDGLVLVDVSHPRLDALFDSPFSSVPAEQTSGAAQSA